jgi:hypothetical protein
MQLETSLGKKLVSSISSNKPDVIMYSCNSSYAGGIGRRIADHASPGKHERPYLKNS